MNIIILAVFALVAVVSAADEPITLLRQDQQINPDGSYQYAWETDNGVSVQEQGALKKINDEEEAIAAQGQFAFKSPEGESFSVVYVADENGFQPQGDHLPVPPPIPELIERALKYLAEHPQEPEQK